MKVKVCRIRDRRSAERLVELGVDFLGFHVLNSERPDRVNRAVTINRALITLGYTGGVLLTRSTDVSWVRSTARAGEFRFVQIHADIDLETVARLSSALESDGVEYIQVVDPIEKSADFIRNVLKHAQYVLYDNYVGGTGSVIPEAALATLPMSRAFVAGGIDASLAIDIQARLSPFGVDVQSWLEKPDGSKDYARVAELLNIARR